MTRSVAITYDEDGDLDEVELSVETPTRAATITYDNEGRIRGIRLVIEEAPPDDGPDVYGA